MRPSIREILADSHIAAIAIAVLLLWSLDGAFQALWGPLSSAASFLLEAVVILDIPYLSPGLTLANRLIVVTTLLYLSTAFINLSAAWLLSRWVYGVGPLLSLGRYRNRLTRRNHV